MLAYLQPPTFKPAQRGLQKKFKKKKKKQPKPTLQPFHGLVNFKKK
jgi:hypothetical protein